MTKLYSGNQCCLCSMRFTASQTDMYADHLDWHFRQNHAGKVASKKVTHRRWYYSLRVRIHFLLSRGFHIKSTAFMKC